MTVRDKKRRAQMVWDYLEGKGTAQIAREYGISRQAVDAQIAGAPMVHRLRQAVKRQTQLEGALCMSINDTGLSMTDAAHAAGFCYEKMRNLVLTRQVRGWRDVKGKWRVDADDLARLLTHDLPSDPTPEQSHDGDDPMPEFREDDFDDCGHS